MKYNLLLKFLRFLVYVKRFFWWLGKGLFLVFSGVFDVIWRFFGYINYKINYLLKKHGISQPNNWILKRDNLQIIIFVVLFLVALPQTKLFTKKSLRAPGEGSIAYAISGPAEEYELEEIAAGPLGVVNEVSGPSWKEGTVSGEDYTPSNSATALRGQELSCTALGGMAITKPIILPGVTVAGAVRSEVEYYIVQAGDSLSSIAYDFDVSVATILWANNLGVNSYIRPGDKLKIPPVTGIMHVVQKGDTLKKIATLYNAKQEDIVRFNKLREDGTDLIRGEQIMIPDGIKPQQIAVARAPRTSQTFSQVATPPPSRQAASASGFVWPSGVRLVTQYYGWKHSGLDIAGPMATPNYAAKAGTVIKSQCGWNSGYGCEIMVDHGGGIVTLYGHNSRLLVSVGEHVEAGQVIGLMGNTGNVRGITGIHLHFEVRVNGHTVNPLGYVK